MIQYIIRVELHEASSEDYENLHEQMKNRKFYREILGSDGRYYHLPTAEYFFETSSAHINESSLRDEVLELARKIRPNPSILVSRADGISAKLKPVS